MTTRADDLFGKAQKLLLTFPFIELANKHFGRASLVGSAATNLMIDADIDIDCEVNKLSKDIITDFVNELLAYKECRKVIVYNQLFDEEPYAIVNVERFSFENEKWILTFFISTDLNHTSRLVEKIKTKLDAESRETILRLKEYRENNNQKRSFPSHLIYEAVLDGGITSIEEFKQFLLRKGIDPDKQDEKI